MRVIILYYCLLYKQRYTLDAVGGQLCIALEKALKWLEKILVFIYRAVLHKLPVFFYNFTYKRFHRLETPLTATCDIMQALA